MEQIQLFNGLVQQTWALAAVQAAVRGPVVQAAQVALPEHLPVLLERLILEILPQAPHKPPLQAQRVVLQVLMEVTPLPVRLQAP
jgi:hypothetical protein